MSLSSGSAVNRITSPDSTVALAEAEALSRDGKWRDAVDRLTRANRAQPDGDLEVALVRMRHKAFAASTHRAPDVPFVPVTAAPGPVEPLEPVAPAALTVDVLREGFAKNGCVLLRGLVPMQRVERLVAGIDCALAGFDAGLDGAPASETAPWYAEFTPVAGNYRVGGRRNWVRKGGAMWTADSPRMLFELLEVVDDLGIGALVTEYLGERPALSANKCTLRRTPIGAANGDWHQDGAFLGPEVRSVNFWLSLSHCGRDAPGLDIVPRRFDEVVETGTGGAHFDWAVGPETVRTAAGEIGPVRPEFAPGDALLFDHLMLHRTAVHSEMRRERHAMETWMFAPSTYPDGQIPLVY
jgi:hypothetical protein